MSRADDAAGERPMPLAGVRIADFTGVLAGPYATYQLALLGADVVKVERPEGDVTRAGAALPGVPGLTAQYVAQNADKRSVVADLKTEDGLRLALALVERSDVVVENFTPGVAGRLGIGFEAARARNPRVVYASMSGYGQDGPWSARPAFDHVVQAVSGVPMLTGAPGSVPNRIGPPLFDYLAGIYGAFAILAALRERDRTGQAQRIDLAMLDAALVAMASTTSAWLNAGIAPAANGNTASSGSPASGIFPTADGLLSIAANHEHHVVAMGAALEPADLLADPRFATPEVRRTHADAFRAALVERLAVRDAAHWERVLSAAHVPAVRVRTVPEVLAEPHVAVRGVRRPVHDEVSGRTLELPSIGFKFNGLALGPERGPARLGADTEAVRRELGLGPSPRD